jgi:hypothetical protein
MLGQETTGAKRSKNQAAGSKRKLTGDYDSDTVDDQRILARIIRTSDEETLRKYSCESCLGPLDVVTRRHD